MDPIIIGLGVAVLWSIIRPGWVYEIGDHFDPRYRPLNLIPDSDDTEHPGAEFNEELLAFEQPESPIARHTVRVNGPLTEEERYEAARALQNAARW